MQMFVVDNVDTLLCLNFKYLNIKQTLLLIFCVLYSAVFTAEKLIYLFICLLDYIYLYSINL